MNALLAFALLALTAVRGEVVNIKTAQDFILFANNVNAGVNTAATVYLQNDIDFTGVSDQFKAIGSGFYNYFGGVFDGQGHTISHLTIENKKNANSQHFGIFTQSGGATIRNLIVDNTCSVTGASFTTTRPGDPLFMDNGGIIGLCEPYLGRECLIENNVFMGKLSYIGNTPTDFYIVLGGIVGEVGSYGHTSTVRNCVNYGSITFSGAADSTIIGGVVGYNVLEMGSWTTVTKISNCLNYGYLTHTGTSRYRLKVGGVLGAVGNGYVEVDNVANIGPISVNSGSGRETIIGTLVGTPYQTKVTNSYWVTGTKFNFIGKSYDSTTTTQCTNFTANAFTLLKNVKVGSYSGNSLIKALNAGADAHSAQKYSKWLLNKNNKAVTFAVNGETPFYKVSTQLILTPALADGVEKKFDGWYTNSACTTKLTNFEVSADTSLYGKFK